MTNNPPVIVDLTTELAKFVIENCKTNMVFGLSHLQRANLPDTQEKLVEMIENFKALKAAVEKGME